MTRRTVPHAQYLVVADESSLSELEAALTTLPLCATGRVFVEVGDASECVDLEVPPRMTLSWLDRSRRSGLPGSGRSCARGVAATRAATAWADEMMCDEGDTTTVLLLGGYLATADIAEHLLDVLHVDTARIAVSERLEDIVRL